jgi:hypothetical protein
MHAIAVVYYCLTRAMVVLCGGFIFVYRSRSTSRRGRGSRSPPPPRRSPPRVTDRSPPRRSPPRGGDRSPPRRSPPRGGDRDRRSPPRGGGSSNGRGSERNNSERISLLCRNIGDRTDGRDLKEAFEQYGDVKDVYIPTDFYTK